MEAVGDVTVSPEAIVNSFGLGTWGKVRVRWGEDVLRKSKAADPGVDHALDPSSEIDAVEGVSTPLVVLLPFVTASDRCLLSVMVAPGLEE